MVLKIVIIAAILYFVFRAVQNLLLAVQEDQRQPPLQSPPRPTTSTPSRPPRRAPRRPAPEIEDAKWEDL